MFQWSALSGSANESGCGCAGTVTLCVADSTLLLRCLEYTTNNTEVGAGVGVALKEYLRSPILLPHQPAEASSGQDRVLTGTEEKLNFGDVKELPDGISRQAQRGL